MYLPIHMSPFKQAWKIIQNRSSDSDSRASRLENNMTLFFVLITLVFAIYQVHTILFVFSNELLSFYQTHHWHWRIGANI